MEGNHSQNEEQEGDVGPLQMVHIGHVVGEQDAQRDEKDPRQHRIATDEQHEDPKKQQIVGHGNLGANGNRFLHVVMMGQEQGDEQHQHHEAHQGNPGPTEPLNRQPEPGKIVGIGLQHRQEVADDEMGAKIKEIRQQQSDEGDEMQTQRALVDDAQRHDAPHGEQQ